MSAFNTMLSKTRDRNWGGTSGNVACEPYLSGYSYIKWTLPGTLKENLLRYIATDSENAQSASAKDNIDAGLMLNSACMSVTPPGGTINKTEITGLGGVKWVVPTSMDYGDSISIRYLEFSGLPILRIHRAWFNMIRDNNSGLTGLQGQTHGGTFKNASYKKANYSATLLYWTTKPDGVTVEYAAAYSGVFPTKDPHDIFVGDITSIDKVEIDMDYNVDTIYNEDWVYKLAQEEAKKKPYGADGATLWNQDGYRYGNTEHKIGLSSTSSFNSTL